MTISYRDAEILYQHGFTEAEITLISNATTPDGKPQQPIDLSSEGWRLALNDSKSIEAGYFRQHPKANHRDYDKWRDEWRKNVGAEKDPWIFIDQFYFRKQAGAVTKKRWEEAYKEIQDLKYTLFID